jgi:hypothetical protein
MINIFIYLHVFLGSTRGEDEMDRAFACMREKCLQVFDGETRQKEVVWKTWE